MEVCWLITTKCDARCVFCHLFNAQSNSSLTDNKMIIANLKKNGIDRITLSGGEPLLYPELLEITDTLKKNDIRTTIISNGHFKISTDLLNNIEEIVFSLDTMDDEINEFLGRGRNHKDQVINSIRHVKVSNPFVNIRINTVVEKDTVNTLDAIGAFLRESKIKNWRLFKFLPIRGKAKHNREQCDISDTQFISLCNKLISRYPEISIQTRINSDYETNYLLILPNGDIVRTFQGEDVIIGNAKFDSTRLL